MQLQEESNGASDFSLTLSISMQNFCLEPKRPDCQHCNCPPQSPASFSHINSSSRLYFWGVVSITIPREWQIWSRKGYKLHRDSRPPYSCTSENACFIFVYKYMATFPKFPNYFIFSGETIIGWACASSFFFPLVKSRTFISPQRAQIAPVCTVCFVVSF